MQDKPRSFPVGAKLEPLRMVVVEEAEARCREIADFSDRDTRWNHALCMLRGPWCC